MSFALPDEVLLHYSHSGGAPPASLDVLTVSVDGTASYLAGNPWPQQPPFDELGWYAAALPEAMWRAIGAGARVAASSSAAGGGIQSDTGREFFAVRVDGRVFTARCNPAHVAPVLSALRAAAHEAIRWLRGHPVRTVRGALALDDRAPDRLIVRLANRGREAFVLQGSAAPGAELEIRAAIRPANGGRAAHTAAPDRLVGEAPLAVLSAEGAPLERTRWRLEPGAAIVLTLDATPIDLGRAAAGVLECLIRLCFPRPGTDGTTFVQEGWLLAAALTLPAAPAGTTS
ncbi:MAG: hypothetical protein GWN84_12995 [Gammaproteobacteria bacterium]|nr:hypothetical protein [Gammaproteobacteria bacterium]NIR58138.1 hypothetical protein [Gammaproteobacteria bacterium]NIR88134.1 hypothetical protein [Gammaproteobacteria bacterium]